MASEIYSEIARLRWPNASPVFGAGRFAIFSRCPETPFVRLFETAEAARAGRENCGHAFCKGLHQTFDLDQQPEPVIPRVFKPKPRWARLLDE